MRENIIRIHILCFNTCTNMPYVTFKFSATQACNIYFIQSSEYILTFSFDYVSFPQVFNTFNIIKVVRN